MSRPDWSDHFENRLTLDHAACKGKPAHDSGCDQSASCAEGCVSFNDGDFHLPVGKLAEFVATLYEAAGKPVPVILERPEPGFSSADLIRKVFGSTVTVTGPGQIKEEHGCGTGGTSGATFGPDVFRRIAACCAQIADEAGAEPDPAEVEELAAEIRSALYPPSQSIGLRPGESDRIAARTALRWFAQREESRDG